MSGGVYVIRNVHMALYELDSPDSHDFITELGYGNISIPVTCRNIWYCTGDTGWRRPTSGHSDVKAKVKIELRTGYLSR